MLIFLYVSSRMALIFYPSSLKNKTKQKTTLWLQCYWNIACLIGENQYYKYNTNIRVSHRIRSRGQISDEALFLLNTTVDFWEQYWKQVFPSTCCFCLLIWGGPTFVKPDVYAQHHSSDCSGNSQKAVYRSLHRNYFLWGNNPNIFVSWVSKVRKVCFIFYLR